jgi:outer membrane protein OmpA-like peptidoglycan-associated protein
MIGISLFSATMAQNQATDVENKVIIRSVYFGGGSYWIDDEQINELHYLLDSIPMAHLERYQISITSHTDNIGGKEYNEWLSKMRSEAVLAQILVKKVPKDNVFIKDFGQENPFFDNRSHQGRMLNRRVDIVFSPVNL